MRPVFADPKTDLVFRRLFGEEAHKHLTISLLDSLIGLEGERRIAELTLLREDGRPRVAEPRRTRVDARCRDHRGNAFVVELRVLLVEAVERSVVYNGSKTYVGQLEAGEPHPALEDVVAVSLCDAVLWPSEPGEPEVPLVSRWRMQEAQGGRLGLGSVRYVLVELPKLPMDKVPENAAEEWAWIFRHAETLDAIPDTLTTPQARAALEAIRTRWFDDEVWDEYDRARLAAHDARDAVLRAVGQARVEGLRAAVRDLCDVLQIERGSTHEASISRGDEASLRALRDALKRDRRWPT
jgi:predicted transposase/invertase (TIGR01784 family)